MKKYILLLLSVITYGQTYQNPTYGTLTLKTNVETTTATKIPAQETSGLINWLQPINIPIPIVPTNYTVSAPTLGGHLSGIDAKFAAVTATTAGISTRVWFTADQTTITAGTFDLTNATSKGTAPSHIQSVVNDDNQKKYYTTDLIGSAFASATLFPPGTYAGNLSASTTPNSAQQRWTVELYKCDTDGTPIASGVTGAAVGSLGVTMIVVLDSGLLTLADGNVTNVQVSGVLPSGGLSMAVGQRIRYHVSAEKVGTVASNITQSVYYGTSYNSFLDVPVPLNTSGVQNLSAVPGQTTTEALNALQNRTFDTSKKWVIYGDSFSNEIASNDYPFYVIQDLKITGTVTNAVAGHRIEHQLAVLKAQLSSTPTYLNAFNIMSLLVGVNDFAGSYPLGNRNSLKTDLNYAGYLKDFIETTLSANPNIELYIMTPCEADGAGVTYRQVNSAGWSLRDLSVLISQICSDYSVKCIDLYSTVQFNLLTIPTYTTDGLHPSTTGVQLIKDVIKNRFIDKQTSFKPVDVSNLTNTESFFPFFKEGTLKNSVLSQVSTDLVADTASPNFILKRPSSANIFNGYLWKTFSTLEGEVSLNSSTAEMKISSGRSVAWGGSIKFYTDTTEKGSFSSVGVFKVDNLSGTGDGAVIASSTGDLKRVPIAITITTSTSITTATLDSNSVGQDGHHVIISNGVNAINLTCNGGVTTSYGKVGTGAITFAQGSGRTLVQLSGTAILSGIAGSTATLWSNGTTDYLSITNY